MYLSFLLQDYLSEEDNVFFFRIFQAVSKGAFRVVSGPILSKIYFTNVF